MANSKERIDALEDAVVTTQVGNPEENLSGEKPTDMQPKRKDDVPGKGLMRGLMQECHPVAYESRKLNEAEGRYTTHEKELLAARWQELLAAFNFMLEYRAGLTNSVVDGLSRRAELDQVALMAMNAIVRADSRVAINIGRKIKKALTRDLVAQQLLKQVESGQTRQLWQEDGLLMTKGRRVYILRVDDLRRTLIRECHDTLWVGHAKGERMLDLFQQGYYWPQMEDEVQDYVKTCLTWQQDKVKHKKKAGLLQPLSVPKRACESVSLYFFTGLPKVEDLGIILVFVDRFSKYAIFIATPKYCSAEDTAQLFFKYVVKYWGMPQDIVSDRDSCFSGNFWLNSISYSDPNFR
ncbi:hypothetical protein RJ639_014542 [Escallonia herrerae]|uniref:Integrase catalytic domain-containing protein n=1 Tax=Escallonia herrerae TaxID=1293975 RepID=A0AA88VJ29_9ASTE|nr:hypothetical protein RJ639_014542 [Escallonia herrerae]